MDQRPDEATAPGDTPPDEDLPVAEARRQLDGPLGHAVFWIAVCIAALHIYFNTFAVWSELRTSALHFGAFGLLCALTIPMVRTRSARAGAVVLALDIAIGLMAVAATAYLFLGERALYARGVSFVWSDWAFTGIAVVLAIEFARRATGWIIPALIVAAITYTTMWGSAVSGVLHFPGLSWETTLYRSFFTDDGMFGLTARISATFVFMFILFGAFLLRSGAGEFIIGIARALAGRAVGAPGFVAVMASGLTGTISGSAVANTVSTGVITIPLMRRAGYPARFAAGVEASASTGGQLMPPIMGAGAFVMASYTQIPYVTIIGVAFLPALLYFAYVAFFVRIEAKKLALAHHAEDAPRLIEVFKRGGVAFLLPIGVLIGLLVQGFTPTYAAGYAIIAVVVSSWLTKRPMGPKAVVEALALGARNMVTTAVLLVAVGLIINVVATTGLGNTFSLMINEWAGGNLLVALVLIALASLVLGMGLPVTAAYIVLATLSAPALSDMIVQMQLVEAFAEGRVPDEAKAVFMLVAPERIGEIGQPMSTEAASGLLALVPAEFFRTLQDQMLTPQAITVALLSAHMIIFWLSQDSNVTPPVCLTAFAAAAIAKTRPMRTGLTAWKIAKALYIVPLLFAYTPFLDGNFWSDLEIFVFALFGLYALAGAIEGHLEAPVSWPMRAVFLVAGIAVLWPNERLVHLAGLALLAVLFAINLRADRRRMRAAQADGGTAPGGRPL